MEFEVSKWNSRSLGELNGGELLCHVPQKWQGFEQSSQRLDKDQQLIFDHVPRIVSVRSTQISYCATTSADSGGGRCGLTGVVISVVNRNFNEFLFLSGFCGSESFNA